MPGPKLPVVLPAYQTEIVRNLQEQFDLMTASEVVQASMEIGLHVLLQADGLDRLRNARRAVRGKNPLGRPKKAPTVRNDQHPSPNPENLPGSQSETSNP
jgi:hypothetical protein